MKPMKTRLLSLLLALALLASVLPSLRLRAEAYPWREVEVSSMEELKQVLEETEPARVIVQKDLDAWENAGEYWCIVKGDKELDLAGHDIKLHNDSGNFASTLFKVPWNAQFTVFNSASGTTPEIHYEGYIHASTLRSYIHTRDLFRVEGKLTVNHVYLNAGRVKSCYNPLYADNIAACVFGTAVIVYESGYAELNNTVAVGRTDPRTVTPTILAYGELVLNNVGVYNVTGGNALTAYDAAKVTVTSGTFSCSHYSQLMLNSYYDVITVTEDGRAGVKKSFLRPGASYSMSGPNPQDSARVQVDPPQDQACELTAQYAEETLYLNSKAFRLPDNQTTITLTGPSNYYVLNKEDSPSGERTVGTYWTVKDGDAVYTNTKVSKNCDQIDVATEFRNFTPQRNKTYVLTAEHMELVGRNTSNAATWTATCRFTISDDFDAPFFADSGIKEVPFSPGETVTMSDAAAGSGVEYQWQYYTAGVWANLRGQTGMSYALENVSAAMVHERYRLKATNAKGTAYSEFMLVRRVDRIDFAGLGTARAGMPLDETKPTTSSHGCEVVAFTWYSTLEDGPENTKYTEINRVDNYVPFPGATLAVGIWVKCDKTEYKKDELAVYLSYDGEECTTKNVRETENGYLCMFGLPPVKANMPTPITQINLRRTPDYGFNSHPEFAYATYNDPQYQVVGYTDVRYHIEGYEWYKDGEKLEYSEDGPVPNAKYELRIKLKPWNDYVFAGAETVRVNGALTTVTRNGDGTVTAALSFYALGGIENPFEDVQESDYYYDAILWACLHEPTITKGVDDTHFAPMEPCTRGQVVTFLWRAAGAPDPTSTDNPFTDVKQGAFYYSAMLWAVEKEITKGTGDGKFSPNDTCTRGQIVTFLWRFAGKPEPSAANPFIDVAAGSYCYKPVLWAVEEGVTKGVTPTTFCPNDPCTRGQVVTFLYRLLGPKG